MFNKAVGKPKDKDKDKEKKPAPKPFSDEQVSEDTERAMLGKPQRYGAALADEEPAEDEEGEVAALAAAPGANKSPEELATPEPVEQTAQISQLQNDYKTLRADIDLIKSKLGMSNGPESAAREPGMTEGEMMMGDGLDEM